MPLQSVPAKVKYISLTDALARFEQEGLPIKYGVLYKMVKDGKIKSRQFSKKLYVSNADVESLINDD